MHNTGFYGEQKCYRRVIINILTYLYDMIHILLIKFIEFSMNLSI